MKPSSSRKMEPPNMNGTNSSNSSSSSDTSESISPALVTVQKRFNLLCDEMKKNNSWSLDIAHGIDICLGELLEEFQQRRQPRTYSDNFVSEIFEKLQYILNRFLVPPGYMLGNLSSTMSSIVKLTTEVAQNENLCEMLRDYGMLQVMTDVFNPSMVPGDLTLMLTCIKLLTTDLVISWKAPYLHKLTDHLYTLIETSDDKASTCLALQILINLCRRNVSCVLVAHENARSKKIWKQLQKRLDRETKAYGLQEILIGHFLRLMTSSNRPADFVPGYEMVGLILKQLLGNYEHTHAYQEKCATFLEAISDQMCSVSFKFKSIYDKCESPLINDAAADEANSLMEGKTAYFQLVEGITTILATFFAKRPETFDESFEIGILHLLVSALPSFIPMEKMLKSYLAGLQITEKLLHNFEASGTTKACLRFYVHVAQQLDKAGVEGLNRQKFKEVEVFLQRILNKLDLVPGDFSPWNMEGLELTLRLFSTLAKQQGFSEKIVPRLKTDPIKGIIHSLTSSPGTKRSSGLSQRSICIMEILFLMAQHTREVPIFDLMMQLMSVPEISSHLAKCIQRGDEDIVSKALVVIGSVGFANNNLPSISKNIVALRNRGNGEMPPTENDAALGSHAGVKRIHDVIRSVTVLEEVEDMAKKNKTGEQSLSTILSCYQLNQEMLEHELASMNTQVIEAKTAIKSLNNLIKKQRNMMNNLLLDKERNDVEMVVLQSRIEKAEVESKTINSASQKEILKLKAELSSEKKAIAALNKCVHEKENALKKLENDIEAINEEKEAALGTANTLREETKSLGKSLNKTKAELEAAKSKCSELEQEVSAKKKELINSRSQLDQQIKIVNTIRGLLGNNTFGGLLGNQ